MATQKKLRALSKEIKQLLNGQTVQGKPVLEPKQKPDIYLNVPTYFEFDFDVLFPHWRDEAPPNGQWCLESLVPEHGHKKDGGSIPVVIKDEKHHFHDFKIKSKDLKKLDDENYPYLSWFLTAISHDLQQQQAVVPMGQQAPEPLLQPITEADVEQIEAGPAEDIKQLDYEKRVQQLVTPSEFTQIMSTLKKALHEDDLGLVQIFDDKGNVVASADKENDALEQLVKLIEEDMSTGQNKATFIGNKYAMVSIRKGANNNPMMFAEVFELLKNLDLTKVADKQKLYNVVELMQKGIQAKDYKDMAKKSIYELYKHPDEYADKPGNKKLAKAKKYSLQDINKLKSFASKYFK